MATYDSITDVMVRIRELPEKVAERTVEIMKEEVPYGEGLHGHLRDTIRADRMADGTYTVGTHKYTKGPYGIREVGAIIRAGRPGLKPRDDHGHEFLQWHDDDGWHMAKEVGPAKPNKFVERTIERINAEVKAKGLGICD